MDPSKETQHDLAAPAALDPRVQAKLRRLRRAIRRRVASEGVAWVLIAAAGVVLATLALDWLLRLERPQRALVMAAAAVGLGWLIWSQLVRPLRVRMRPIDLSLLVEQRFEQLQGRLASAVEFASAPAPPGISGAMIGRVVARAGQLAATLPFTDVIERRQVRRTWRVALCALGLIVGLTVWQGGLMRLWAMRNLLLADAPWPQRTYLTIGGDTHDFVVVRGDDLDVPVATRAGSESPPFVTVHARWPSVGGTEEQVEPAETNGGRFAVVFRQVTEPFEFYVIGGDDQRDKRRPHRVTLIEPPALREAVFTVERPSYAHRPPQTVDGSAGMIPVPVGSAIRFDGIATKDLSAAAAVVSGEGISLTEPLQVDSTGHGRPRGVFGRFGIDTANEPMALSLRIALVDTAGHTNRRSGRYVLRIEPDQAPALELARAGVGPTLTPAALVPLLMTAKDDCGLAGLSVALGVAENEAAVTEPVSLPLADRPLTETTIRHELDLMGRGLQVDQVIRISAEAVDTLPVDLGGPNRRTSGVLSFRIVRPEDLWLDLITRQKALRTEFVQAHAQQGTARGKALAAGEAITDASISADARTELVVSAGVQQAVGAEVATAAETLRQVADEMTYNRLGLVAEVQALRGNVISGLDELSVDIDRVTAELRRAMTESDPAALREQVVGIAAEQDRIARRMEEILQHMVQLQSRQELANQLRVILRWSREIQKQIKQKQAEEIGNILEGAD